jgi:hypothetical protein
MDVAAYLSALGELRGAVREDWSFRGSASNFRVAPIAVKASS